MTYQGVNVDGLKAYQSPWSWHKSFSGITSFIDLIFRQKTIPDFCFTFPCTVNCDYVHNKYCGNE